MNNSFTIYNASAGSGKTFTLVKEYLKILLKSNYPDQFKQILAITFTNKAVNEMKERVMLRLEDFTKEKEQQEDPAMFELLADELKLGHQEIQTRSKKILKHILHNYAFFDIVTIDKFNHRLLRTFAYDLKLPINFEVVIDEVLLLEEVTDKLIFNAGTDDLLTSVLINYALGKADDDKSWDISRDLYRVAKLLLKEDYAKHLKEIQNVSLRDLQIIEKQLQHKLKKLEEETIEIAQTILQTIKQKNIEYSDFNGGYLPGFFTKVANGDLMVSFETKWQQNIHSEKLYPKRIANTPAANAIEALQPWLAQQFDIVKHNVINIKYRQNFLKNLTPLSLLSAINTILQQVKQDENILLISEFNQIISKEIGTQPAPFIYERLGEKYRHYFIDEFQDTSRMQWNNLIPLISNALESENLSGQKGTLMLVGDAKQAIYRWRGGVAEQFIDLYRKDGKNPFQIEKHVFSLPRNHRSCEEVILFNNEFFKHISAYLTNPGYRRLFAEHSHQEINKRKNGYIQLSFIEKDTAERKIEAYCELTFKTIQQLMEEGKLLKDISILTRKKSEGVAIASYLTEKGIPVISSDSLLLKNDIRVAFLIDLMKHAVQPEKKETVASLLLFLGRHEKNKIHETMNAYLDKIENAFNHYNFKLTNFQKLPLTEAIEYAIISFKLQKFSDAYLQYFLDEVLDYSIHNNLSFTDFLAYWEKKENNLSIVSPPTANAIKIMTIHKAKGLEFPVVIYPFADSKINEDLDRELWLPVSQKEFGLNSALFTRNKDLTLYSDFTREMCELQESKLQLDQYNILYVALTRAVEQLYIFTLKDISSKGIENTNTYSGLFINYLKSNDDWNDAENTYSFGEKPKLNIQKKIPEQQIIPFSIQNPLKRPFKIITKGGSLWETALETALEKGNLYHLILSRVQFADDLPEVLQESLINGELGEMDFNEVSKQLNQLIDHPEITPYFKAGYTIYNEHDIYTKDGVILRPDRLVVDAANNVVLIDYKTGSFNNKYIDQLNSYEKAVNEMGFNTKRKLLVFINEKIEVRAV